jgi:hypothetical protein
MSKRFGIVAIPLFLAATFTADLLRTDDVMQ